jgi:hypothetical protein
MYLCTNVVMYLYKFVRSSPLIKSPGSAPVHEGEHIELLNKTNIVDYAKDIHKSHYHAKEVPQGLFLSFSIIIYLYLSVPVYGHSVLIGFCL